MRGIRGRAGYIPAPSDEPVKTQWGWAQSGDLRNDNGAFSSPPGKGIGMQVEFPDAGVYTVQFYILNNNAIPVAAEALITWSTNGNNTTRRISVVNGAAITGVAQHVKVSVWDASSLGVLNTQSYTVFILVAPGNRATNSNPPFLSRPAFKVAPTHGTSTSVPIPTDAGAISVQTSVWITTAPVGLRTDVQVAQVANGLATLRSYSPLDEPDFVPLVPQTDTIRCDNRSAGDTINFSFILGIEG